ncbi:beta-L-arabinofuranosidase domain-containing protein [Halalkalibacillus halophilus]|uniref:beta-L-arabinofuranosidase domain-containing protein n=1 Tax=Halalkalibacillus halophilus TaxID=392827 RepID=UPI000403E4E5|nr:beta-L-arabinofuranosidase domain-containing protein [Halalkalibacillus halophilus]
MTKQMDELWQAIKQEKWKKVKRINWKAFNFSEIDGHSIVFLTASDSAGYPYISQAREMSIGDAVSEATAVLLRGLPNDFKVEHLKLEVVEQVKKEQDVEEIRLNKGVAGLAFDGEFSVAFTPQEVASYNLVNKRALVWDRVSLALRHKLGSTSDFAEDSWKDLYKFTTRAFYADGVKSYPLSRGQKYRKEVVAGDVLESIQMAKNNYFQHVVKGDGEFIYSYLPSEDLEEGKYNILRHAGTVYSMLETYELEPDEALMASCKRAIEYLMDHMEESHLNGNAVNVLIHDDVLKLGGNGLALVALAKYTDITGDETYLDTMQGMATYIKEIQSENGDFEVHKMIYSTGEVSEFRSFYYIGEAMLGLTRLYAIDGDEQWLDVAEKTAEYLIHVQNKGATAENILHDHWFLYGLHDLYQHRPEQKYADYAMLMAEGIMQAQYGEDEEYAPYRGGYKPENSDVPKSVPNACRAEGLIKVYYLARAVDEDKVAERVLDSLDRSIRFQLQSQVRPEQAMYFPNKALATGAFYSKLKGNDLRNDYTQHNISSLIGYYRILTE